jgi:hypothetical protein
MLPANVRECSVYGPPATVPIVETEQITPEGVHAETEATIERVPALERDNVELRSVSALHQRRRGVSTPTPTKAGPAASTSCRWQ